MTRIPITDDAFHGGEPLPIVRIDAHRPAKGLPADGGLYPFIPCVAAPPVPTAARHDAPAGEAPPAPFNSPAGTPLRRKGTRRPSP